MENLVTDPAFWRGKRVFLTGHTGFKGGWLALWLQKLGATVFGYALPPPTEPNLYTVAKVPLGLAGETKADIRDGDRLARALAAAKPDVVFHLAAQAIVLRSHEDPIETFSTNVVGTVTLLQALRAVESVRAVVVVTSDKCYANREWVWGYRENDPMGGGDPYSASKGAAELATASMRDSFFSDSVNGGHPAIVATARAGNVIGGGDWAPDRLVPDMIRSLENGTPCHLRNPSAVRPWQHVLEPLSGYLLLAQAMFRCGRGFEGGWNFGPRANEAVPVSTVAETLATLWGDTPDWISANKAGPLESTFLKLDISKAQGHLGWSPTWPIASSLAAVVEWHRAYLQGKDMQMESLGQIDAYSRDSGANQVRQVALAGRPNGLAPISFSGK